MTRRPGKALEVKLEIHLLEEDYRLLAQEAERRHGSPLVFRLIEWMVHQEARMAIYSASVQPENTAWRKELNEHIINECAQEVAAENGHLDLPPAPKMPQPGGGHKVQVALETCP